MPHFRPRAHRRQFLISRTARPGWLAIALPEGLVLSYDAALPVHREGEKITLGIRTPDRAGRFAVVDWPYIYPDTGGLLAIYYGAEGIGSSQALLGAKPKPVIEKSGLNYFPVPGSRFRDVRTLLRDQRLHIPSGAAEFNDRAPMRLAGFDVARETLTESLVETCRVLSKSAGRVLLGLTAGLDSRTVMACLRAGGVPFEAVTQTFPGMDRTDVDTARQLCKRFGVTHHVMTPQRYDQDDYETWRRHTGEGFNDTDMHWFPLQLWRFLRPDDLFLKGGCFELGRWRYGRAFDGMDWVTATGERIVAALGASHDAEVLDEWLGWRRSHPNGLDLVDGFHLDQRIGGWRGCTEQSKDALIGEFIHPANSPAAFNALLTPSLDERIGGRLQRELIRRLEPGLLDLPFNTPSRARGIARTVRRHLRRMVMRPQQA